MIIKVLIVINVFLVLLMCAAGSSHSQITPAGTADSVGVMRPDLDTLAKWKEDYDNAPTAHIDTEVGLMLKTAKQAVMGTSMDLFSHLDYVANERDQGNCGNCWVWATMGVLEIADSVNYGSDRTHRHSIQLLNSCMTQYEGKAFYACNGGNITKFSDWYRGEGFSIPWSNTNASWVDGTCSSTTASCVSCSNIATNPYYSIAAIQPVTVVTRGVGVTQDVAITNIKNVLQQNKAVEFDFCMANYTDWTNFVGWWRGQSESTLLNADSYCGHTIGSDGKPYCHAVLLVGYNDDDADASKHYWVLLNSWGTSNAPNRPNGLFHVPMVMDYSCTMISGTAPNTTTYTTRDFWTLNTGSSPNTLTVTKSGSGAVTSTPAGISCGATCSATYASGTIVTLTATALSGSTFSGWGGDCTGTSSTCTVTMDKGKVVTATFTAAVTSTLTIAKLLTNNANGTVISTPAGISCGNTCKYGFSPGDTVTLNATPNASSGFTGWSGGGCSGADTCVVTMNSNTTVTAAFSSATLNVFKGGSGTGTITSTPSGISCGNTCKYGFSPGTSVTLSATPLPGSVFTGWSGACGTDPCTVTTTATANVTATFDLTCTYSAVSTIAFNYKGGYKTVKLTAVNNGGGACPAPAINIDPSCNWLSYDKVTFGNAKSDKNKGSVRIRALPYTDSYEDRPGTVDIGTDPVTPVIINQTAKPCSLGPLVPPNALYDSPPGGNSFTVTPSPGDCNWTAVKDPSCKDCSWITITSADGSNPVAYSIEENTTGKNRTGKIIVMLTDKPTVKRTFTIRQTR